jgi:hypothetical protein
LCLRYEPTMKVEGIKGCFEKTGGLFYFARMCSKVRLHAQGKLPKDYHEMLGQGFDGRTCRYLRVRYEDVRAQVLSGKTDVEVLDWCFANGRRLTDEEILIYNSFMSKRGWHDDETDGFIPEMILRCYLGVGEAQSFSKRGSLRSGSQNGSKRRSATVMPAGTFSKCGMAAIAASRSPKSA